MAAALGTSASESSTGPLSAEGCLQPRILSAIFSSAAASSSSASPFAGAAIGGLFESQATSGSTGAVADGLAAGIPFGHGASSGTSSGSLASPFGGSAGMGLFGSLATSASSGISSGSSASPFDGSTSLGLFGSSASPFGASALFGDVASSGANPFRSAATSASTGCTSGWPAAGGVFGNVASSFGGVFGGDAASAVAGPFGSAATSGSTVSTFGGLGTGGPWGVFGTGSLSAALGWNGSVASARPLPLGSGRSTDGLSGGAAPSHLFSGPSSTGPFGSTSTCASDGAGVAFLTPFQCPTAREGAGSSGITRKRRHVETTSEQEAVELQRLQKSTFDLANHSRWLETKLSQAEAQVEASRVQCAQLAGERAALERLSDPALEALEAKVVAASKGVMLEWRRRCKARVEEHMCSVCLDKPRTVVLLPCRHCILCKQCLGTLQSNGSVKCPQCRVDVGSHIEFYG